MNYIAIKLIKAFSCTMTCKELSRKSKYKTTYSHDILLKQGTINHKIQEKYHLHYTLQQCELRVQIIALQLS
jgi:hypothetical protein